MTNSTRRDASVPAEAKPSVHTMKEEQLPRNPSRGHRGSHCQPDWDKLTGVSYWVPRSQMLLTDCVIQDFKLQELERHHRTIALDLRKAVFQLVQGSACQYAGDTALEGKGAQEGCLVSKPQPPQNTNSLFLCAEGQASMAECQHGRTENSASSNTERK